MKDRKEIPLPEGANDVAEAITVKVYKRLSDRPFAGAKRAADPRGDAGATQLWQEYYRKPQFFRCLPYCVAGSTSSSIAPKLFDCRRSVSKVAVRLKSSSCVDCL